jgi:hypothetical protein
VAPAASPSSLRPLCAVPHAGEPQNKRVFGSGSCPKVSPWGARDRFPSGNGARAARWGWKYRRGHLPDSPRAHAASEPSVVSPPVFHHTRGGHDISFGIIGPLTFSKPPRGCLQRRGTSVHRTETTVGGGVGWVSVGSSVCLSFGPPGLENRQRDLLEQHPGLHSKAENYPQRVNLLTPRSPDPRGREEVLGTLPPRSAVRRTWG